MGFKVRVTKEEATGIPQPSAEVKRQIIEYVQLHAYMMTKDEDQLGYSVAERAAEAIYKKLTPRQQQLADSIIIKMMARQLDVAIKGVYLPGGPADLEDI